MTVEEKASDGHLYNHTVEEGSAGIEMKGPGGYLDQACRESLELEERIGVEAETRAAQVAFVLALYSNRAGEAIQLKLVV